MKFHKRELVTAGTDENWIGTVAAVKDEHEADPLYLVAFHKHPAEWIRGHYLYRYSPRVPVAEIRTDEAWEYVTDLLADGEIGPTEFRRQALSGGYSEDAIAAAIREYSQAA